MYEQCLWHNILVFFDDLFQSLLNVFDITSISLNKNIFKQNLRFIYNHDKVLKSLHQLQGRTISSVHDHAIPGKHIRKMEAFLAKHQSSSTDLVSHTTQINVLILFKCTNYSYLESRHIELQSIRIKTQK